MTERVPTGRTWTKRAVAIGLAVGMTLLLAEVVLRWSEPPVYAPRETVYGFAGATFGDPPEGPIRVLRPNATVRYRWDGDPYGTLPPGAELACPLNGEGLRGPLPTGTAPAVLFVGDSFTFGEGVEEPATFVRRLAEGGGGRYVTVNAGIPGAGSFDQRVRTPSWLRTFAPRVVVLVYNLNDPIPVEESLRHGEDFMNVASKPREGSRLLGLLRPRGPSGETWYRDHYLGERSDAWRRARLEIGRMRAAAESAGASFGVAIFPLLHRLDAYPFGDVHELIVRDLRADGLEVLDLLPAFEGHEARSLWVHPTDHHPNGPAHELAAAALRPFVDRLLTR